MASRGIEPLAHPPHLYNRNRFTADREERKPKGEDALPTPV